MSAIPEDIMETAQEVWLEADGKILKTDAYVVIALAILAERERSRTLLSEADQREKDARREGWSFAEGDLVHKKSGSWWEGRVVGTYSTAQTPRGYAVQLDKPNGPVQIYPESALESALQSEDCPTDRAKLRPIFDDAEGRN